MKRYTRFVGFTKLALCVLILALVGLVVALPMFDDSEGGIRIAFSNIEQKDGGSPKMMKPQFRGVDAQNQPYTLTADYALQKDMNTVQLSNLSADINLKEGRWLSLTARDGILHVDDKMVEARGNVNVFYDLGYEFTTEELHINIQDKTAYCDVPVEGQGDLGTISASGFRLTQGEGILRFKGPVKMTIYSGKKS